METKFRLGLWAALAAIVLIAVPSMFHFAPKFIGKSLFDSSEFQWQLDEAYEDLSVNVLNRIDREQAKERIQVTDEEIEEHRNRYGTLSEQLANVQDQYRDRIAEAKETKNETLLLALVKERDGKLADIQANFDSDEHVERKIRSAKEKQLDDYLDELNERYSRNFPIAYELTDVETGERFSKGDVAEAAAYKQVFNESRGYFRAVSITEHAANYGHSDAAMDLSGMTEEDFRQIKNPTSQFEGVLIIPKKALAAGGLKQQYKDFTYQKYTVYGFWLLGALAFVALLTTFRFRKEWVTQTKAAVVYNHWKIDLKAVLLFLTASVLLVYLESTVFQLQHELYPLTMGKVMSFIVKFALFGGLPVALLAFQLVNLTEQLKKEGHLASAWRESYMAQMFGMIKEMLASRSIGMQLFLCLIVFFLAGIGFAGFFAGILFNPVLFVLYAGCVAFVGLPAFFLFVKRGAYLNRILASTEAMAAGYLHNPIPIKGKSPLAKHAQNLNNLREGVRKSMTEQAKSERLKTELITNVSHDLRTPLTSIITYTDLLKDESLTAEERAKYVTILDQKSQRLKTLIEDLFEVSKMASGNLELQRQRVDLAQLLQQALAEHADDFEDCGLDLRVTMPEIPLIANVDGQKWWRVLDNLIVNALKYSLPGTRIYVTLQEAERGAQFIIKNIAKYEIGGETDELFERFKRGDESRQTEGSGLGLAIAQSIVDMHGGQMEIDVDGDLFKVTVTI